MSKQQQQQQQQQTIELIKSVDKSSDNMKQTNG